MMKCILKDLIEYSKDGEWGKDQSFEESEEMLCIRGTDFESARFGSTEGVPRRFIAKRHADRKRLQPWDVLIEAAGGTKDQPTGRTVLLKPSIFRRASLPLTCASFSRLIRFRTDLCDPAFMFWYLQSLYHSDIMRAYHTQHTGVARFQWTTFAENEPLQIPNLPAQRKIACILSAYDDMIENNLRRIEILEEMAQSLYREWFVHFRFPGHESARFIESGIGRIPKGWEIKNLGELADQMRRGVPKGELEGTVRYVGLEHIPRQSLALDAWEETTELGSNKLTFERGEVLFGKIRPYFHKVSVAPFDGICSADTIVIRSKKPEYRALVTACVFTEAFVAHATATSNGSKMPRTDWKVLKDYPHVLPPKELLTRFSALFENSVAQQQNLVSRNHTLRRTRDLLLPKLLQNDPLFKP